MTRWIPRWVVFTNRDPAALVNPAFRRLGRLHQVQVFWHPWSAQHCFLREKKIPLATVQLQRRWRGKTKLVDQWPK